jgi:1-deoxy-D-xylulose-5-phosphate reductoisomerase
MTAKRKVLVLGATGSIGKSALDIIRSNPDRFKVAGLCAHKNKAELDALSREFNCRSSVLVSDSGEGALLSMIADCDADIAVNGISGASGLLPSRAVLERGMDLALANKETIVMAGPLVRALAASKGSKILPVDSEHSAVFSLIEAHGKDSIAEIILTASGGPFRTVDSSLLPSMTARDALKHPTWSMGAKITIDSASLANKGLEVIEAVRLFDVPPDRVKVVVHPESLVHSFVRTKDGVLYAQISKPDMRHPIHAALTWPDCSPSGLDELSFEKLCTMRFEPPRYADFPLLGLAYRAAGLAGSYTIAFNAANEEAVSAFERGSLSFTALAEVTARVLDRDWSTEPASFDDVLGADARARDTALCAIKELSR